MRVLFVLCLALAACPKPSSKPDAGPVTQPLFTVKNECPYDIWVQQQNMPASTPAVVKLTKGASKTYDIPVVGLASTRFWAKTGCDSTGQNCLVGQSSPPCPATGCAPPIDSKIEATWGCALSEKVCGKTPQGKTLKGDTFWNGSSVDGYTLSYRIDVGANGGAGCAAVNCNELWQGQCPTAENLSTDGKYPDLKNINLNVFGPKPDGGAAPVLGCFSTCMALTASNDGGKGYQPSDPQAQMYCCPTPPISSPACQKGPVVKTKYVQAVHGMCHGTSYAYTYDDGLGTRTCTPDTKITMTYCPPQPAK